LARLRSYHATGAWVSHALLIAKCHAFIRSGDVLITQGDLDAQLFYVVGEGECSVLVSVPEDLKTIKVILEDACLVLLAFFVFRSLLTQVATKVRGDCFGELALMTISPRAATVMVTSNSASVFTLERQDFQHFVVSSGMRAAHHFITTSILPEAPEVPDNYMIVPKSTPFHPNCIALLPQPELSRDPSDASQAARPRAFSAASPGSPALARFHGLLLQPWPDALNDSLVDVLGDFLLSTCFAINLLLRIVLAPFLLAFLFTLQFRILIPKLPKKYLPDLSCASTLSFKAQPRISSTLLI
jgi:hypothetical protein